MTHPQSVVKRQGMPRAPMTDGQHFESPPGRSAQSQPPQAPQLSQQQTVPSTLVMPSRQIMTSDGMADGPAEGATDSMTFSTVPMVKLSNANLCREHHGRCSQTNKTRRDGGRQGREQPRPASLLWSSSMVVGPTYIPESLRVGERGADEGVGGVDEAEVQHAAAGLLVFLGVRLLARVRNDDLHLVAAHAHGDEGELSLHVANVDAVEAEGGDGRIEGDGDGLLRLEELVSGDGVLAIVVAAVDFAGPGANRGHDAREGQVQRRLLVEHELLEAVGGHAIQVVEEGVASVVGVRVDGQRRDVVLAALRVEIFVKEDGRAHGLHGRRERDQQRELEECHDVL
mmetsp:Transcript_10891/g.40760  ORF Transcript_10891/g.40760 Transcript_10891/m.40760 type:complete len:342 (-) Transcript_10891:95-1120(-)